LHGFFETTGYLAPSLEGAWLLPETGEFVRGKPDEPPQAGATWRSYYLCAGYILDIYVNNNIGMDKIAYRLNTEGWPFRDRKGNPRPMEQEDIRRVIANWPEYGGLVPDKRAKDRAAYADDVDPAHLIEERAVFPISLLRRVAEVRRDRTREPKDDGINRKARAYPLSSLVYCAHCDTLAHEREDPRLRVKLTGLVDPRQKRRYKHKPGVICGVTNRTVPAEEIEAEFGRLLTLLTIKEEALEYMTEMAIRSQQGWTPSEDEVDLEQQRREAITLCQRKIDAAVHLYGDGRISREEYLRRVDANEREIAHWEARTTEVEQKALELAMCIEAVNRIAETWESASDEDKQGMAQHLFSEVVVDLDTRRIVSYKLKPWADDFLMLRMELYHEEFGDLEEGGAGYQSALEKANSNTLLGCWNPVPHRGRDDTSVFEQLRYAARRLMLELYLGMLLPGKPVSHHTPSKCERNEEIRLRHRRGESLSRLAEVFGLSEQRIWQIVNSRRK
jgi:hypothetical protein